MRSQFDTGDILHESYRMKPQMPYLPTEDVQKLHAEINQINHARFLICLAGVSVFGVFGLWTAPSIHGISNDSIVQTVWNTIYLQVVFGILVGKAQVLRMKAKFLAAYLKKVGASVWESDLAIAKLDGRTAKYGSLDSIAQTITFMSLGLLPVVALSIQAANLNTNDSKNLLTTILFLALCSIVYATWILVLHHTPWFNKDIYELEKKWDEVLKKTDRWQEWTSNGDSIIRIPKVPSNAENTGTGTT